MEHSGGSTSDQDVLKEINGVRSCLMIQLKSELKEVLRFRRYVGGYCRLSGRTNLGAPCQSQRGAQTICAFYSFVP